MPRGVLVLDGFDTSTIGLTLIHPLRGWREHIWQEQEAKPRPRRLAYLRTGTSTKSRPRPFRLRGVLEAATHVQLQSRIDELGWRLGGATNPLAPLFRLKFDTAATRYWDAYVDGEVQMPMREGGISAADVEASLVAFDPRAYDDTATVLGPFNAAAGNQDLVLGTALHEVITISVNNANTFRLDYKDSAGTTLASLGLISATGTQPYVINIEDETIVDSAGTPVKKMDFLDPANQTFFKFDPHDGDFLAPAWPKIATTAGDVTVTFKRAWKSG